MANVTALAAFLTAGLSLIALSPQLPPGTDQLCRQTGLFGQGLCVMYNGVSANRTYTSQVPLTSRMLVNKTTALGAPFGAQPFLRPDMHISAASAKATVLSEARGVADIYMDYFLCSESNCEAVVDINYVQKPDGRRGVGFQLGMVPFTNLAVGLILGQQAQGAVVNVSVDLQQSQGARITGGTKSFQLQGNMSNVQDNFKFAVLGTRVLFEALTDFLLTQPSLGLARVTIGGRCTLLLFPGNPWYQKYIVSQYLPCSKPNQTFALLGVSNHNWCLLCDPFSLTTVNHQQGCYLSNAGSCPTLEYPSINETASGFQLRLYNISAQVGDYSNDQTFDPHPWTRIMFEMVSEGRQQAAAGCNYSGNAVRCTACSDRPATDMSCPGAPANSSFSAGFGDLLTALDYVWVTSLDVLEASMLGFERVHPNALVEVVEVAEEWGYELADSTLRNTVVLYDQVLSLTGFMTTCLTYVVAIVGAWAAYPAITEWLRNAFFGESKFWAGLVAGVVTTVFTAAPMLIVAVKDHALSTGNEEQMQRSYLQSMYDVPGIGNYKLVAIAQIDTRFVPTGLAWKLGLPLFLVLLILDGAAWAISERSALVSFWNGFRYERQI